MKRGQFITMLSRLAIVAIAVSLCVGCKAPWSSDWKLTDMFRLDKGLPWQDGPEEGVPSRLVATWTDAVLHQAGKTPQRGFGGRLIFYGKENNDPILVDGQLVVYAFDEASREPTDNRPTRRYVFPADQIALHMSESELGPTYSFWLPWDEVGGPQTEISLIARFEPQGGAVVVGEQTKHLLPGVLVNSPTLTRSAGAKLPNGIPMRPAIEPTSYSIPGGHGARDMAQQAGYEQAVTSDGTRGATIVPVQSKRMTTTTISLPDNFRSRGGAATTRAASAPSDVRPVPVAAQPAIGAQPIGGEAGTGHTAQPGAGSPAHSPACLPYAPSPAVTPLSSAGRFGSGLNVAMPSTQAASLPAQKPVAGEVTTSVSYLSAAESARWGVRPQSSTGSGPAPLPVPATPASQ